MAATQIRRVRDLASEIREQLTVTREILATYLEAVSTPPPDTFLGRKTQEPFPKEEMPLFIGLGIIR